MFFVYFIAAGLIGAAVGYKAHGDTIWLNGSGNQVSAKDAVLAELKGEKTFKCQEQELKVNQKSGTIGSRNKKKSLSKEDVESAIADLKAHQEKSK
jgi:hypothetical protein